MNTWLQLLPLELEGINETDYIEPTQHLEKGDRELGDMSDISKRLHTLAELLEKDSKQNLLNAQYCADNERKLELMAKYYELGMKCHSIRDIMWIGLRGEFGVWGADSIGVRVGFKVVESSPGVSGYPFLRLFGIGE